MKPGPLLSEGRSGDTPHVIDVSFPGFTRQKVQVTPPGFFKGMRLLVDGHPAAQDTRRGEYLLTDDKGQSVRVKFRHQAFGLDYPQLMVGKQFINIVPPLKWYWWALAVLPILLVIVGAGLGGLIGIIAAWINLRLLRLPWHWLARLAATLGVFVVAMGLWLMLYLLINGAL